ncbi:hypothetical protein FKW77_004585 [Venturia effusa]|uniref:Uncharacterized protein n=1 Tax=Venturia effusa TaxID=50376 RepID=A0A517LLD1_9PEZI|nr:hypothetical protein FKW77_004585 [Venturia effusa]
MSSPYSYFRRSSSTTSSSSRYYITRTSLYRDPEKTPEIDEEKAESRVKSDPALTNSRRPAVSTLTSSSSSSLSRTSVYSRRSSPGYFFRSSRASSSSIHRSSISRSDNINSSSPSRSSSSSTSRSRYSESEIIVSAEPSGPTYHRQYTTCTVTPTPRRSRRADDYTHDHPTIFAFMNHPTPPVFLGALIGQGKSLLFDLGAIIEHGKSLLFALSALIEQDRSRPPEIDLRRMTKASGRMKHLVGVAKDIAMIGLPLDVRKVPVFGLRWQPCAGKETLLL